MRDATQNGWRCIMQVVGNYLEQLGPVFGVLFLALVAAVGIASFAVSLPRLIKREA